MKNFLKENTPWLFTMAVLMGLLLLFLVTTQGERKKEKVKLVNPTNALTVEGQEIIHPLNEVRVDIPSNKGINFDRVESEETGEKRLRARYNYIMKGGHVSPEEKEKLIKWEKREIERRRKEEEKRKEKRRKSFLKAWDKNPVPSPPSSK